MLRSPSRKSVAWSRKISRMWDRDTARSAAMPGRWGTRAVTSRGGAETFGMFITRFSLQDLLPLWTATQSLYFQFSTQNISHSSSWRQGRGRRIKRKLKPIKPTAEEETAWEGWTVGWKVRAYGIEFSLRWDWTEDERQEKGKKWMRKLRSAWRTW